MEEFNVATLLADIAMWTTAVIGGASLLVQGIAVITGVTPTTRDDEIVGRIQAVIAKIQLVLNGLALNSVKTKTKVTVA